MPRGWRGPAKKAPTAWSSTRLPASTTAAASVRRAMTDRSCVTSSGPIPRGATTARVTCGAGWCVVLYSAVRDAQAFEQALIGGAGVRFGRTKLLSALREHRHRHRDAARHDHEASPGRRRRRIARSPSSRQVRGALSSCVLSDRHGRATGKFHIAADSIPHRRNASAGIWRSGICP
jgi:hypothetical protein